MIVITSNRHILLHLLILDVKGIAQCYDHEFVIVSSIVYGNN